MGADAPTDVITDTSTLVNFLRIGRVDLLADLTSYRFVVTDHVRAEVTIFYPAQLANLEFALMAGHKKPLPSPGEESRPSMRRRSRDIGRRCPDDNPGAMHPPAH